MELLTFLLVGVGGALGAGCRAGLIALVEKRVSHWLATGVLCANVLACFLAGAFLALSLAGAWRALLMTGFCGGFSTLSAVNLDAAKLLLQGGAQGRGRCAAYLVATYALALFAAAVGFVLFS